MVVRKWNPPQPAGPPIGTGPHGPGPELVAYARVSTREQREDSQTAALTEAGCSRLFIDKGVSGKLAKRPELDACLEYMREGDTLVITRLSRAMRSLSHLLNVAEGLRERGIGLKVLKQDIDTTNATGRFLFHILAAVDELQREIIVEGTLEGLAIARAKGHHGGTPRLLSYGDALEARKLLDDGWSASAVARHLSVKLERKVSRPSLYRAMEWLEAGERW